MSDFLIVKFMSQFVDEKYRIYIINAIYNLYNFPYKFSIFYYIMNIL
jgi:hypothetical protein